MYLNIPHATLIKKHEVCPRNCLTSSLKSLKYINIQISHKHHLSSTKLFYILEVNI